MLTTEFLPHRTCLLAGTEREQKLFAMLKLLPDPDLAKTKPPLAMALVVDTSMSMYEFTGQDLDRSTKLEIAINAAHKLVDDPRLSQGDQITIIHFNDNAQTLQELTSLWNRQSIHQAIVELSKHSGTTNMAAGMDNAVVELSKADGSLAKRVFLLTDGATVGEEKCYIIARQLAMVNAPIIAIGLGDTYNDVLLSSISEITQGRPYHLHEISDLEDILETEVGSSVKEVVTNLRAGVSTIKGVELQSLTRVYPNLAQSELSDGSFHLGNVMAGDYTVLIAEFNLSGVVRDPSRVRLAQLSLAGNAPGKQRYMELPPLDLFVEFTDDEIAVSQINQEVMGYVQQKNIDHLVSQATRIVGSDPDKAKTLLLNAQSLTKRLENPAFTKVLDNALTELGDSGTISTNTSRTMVLGSKTKTVRTMRQDDNKKLSDDEIRKMTGV